MAASDPYFDILISAVRNPKRYKLCAVCGNVVDNEADACVYCCAYRFVTEPDLVSNAALDQATHTRSAVTSTAHLVE